MKKIPVVIDFSGRKRLGFMSKDAYKKRVKGITGASRIVVVYNAPNSKFHYTDTVYRWNDVVMLDNDRDKELLEDSLLYAEEKGLL